MLGPMCIVLSLAASPTFNHSLLFSFSRTSLSPLSLPLPSPSLLSPSLSLLSPSLSSLPPSLSSLSLLSLPSTEEQAARLEMAGGDTRRRPSLLLSRGYQTNYLECTGHILMIPFSHSHSTSLTTMYNRILLLYCRFVMSCSNVLFQCPVPMSCSNCVVKTVCIIMSVYTVQYYF